MNLRMSSSSKPYLTKTLFNGDGVTVTATILTNASNKEYDNLDNDFDSYDSPVILTLYLHRHDEKNVINPAMIELLLRALDAVESSYDGHHKSLIITGLSPPPSNNNADTTKVKPQPSSSSSSLSLPKFFCNGLDLEWFASTTAPSSRPLLIERFCSQVLARLLTLPMRTVAAVNGHCIGAGLFLALCCDYRIMRDDRGYVQWPETKLGMRLTKGFAELSKAKVIMTPLSSSSKNKKGDVWREGILGAKRYTPREAMDSGIVDDVVSAGELYDSAFERAVEGLPERLGLDCFDPNTFSAVKMELYTDAYRALRFGKVEDLPHSRI